MAQLFSRFASPLDMRRVDTFEGLAPTQPLDFFEGQRPGHRATDSGGGLSVWPEKSKAQRAEQTLT